MSAAEGAKQNWVPLVITGVIAIGVSFILVWQAKGSLRDELAAKEELQDLKTKQAEDMKKKDAEIAELKKESGEFQTWAKTELKKQEDMASNQGKALEETKNTLDTTNKTVTKDREDFNTFKSSTETSSKQQAQELTNHAERLQKVESRIKALDVVEKDIAQLKGDTTELKADAQKLRSDLLKVKEKGEVTAEDLDKLTERSRLFQQRVHLAHVKQIAESKRQEDLKQLWETLGD